MHPCSCTALSSASCGTSCARNFVRVELINPHCSCFQHFIFGVVACNRHSRHPPVSSYPFSAPGAGSGFPSEYRFHCAHESPLIEAQLFPVQIHLSSLLQFSQPMIHPALLNYSFTSHLSGPPTLAEPSSFLSLALLFFPFDLLLFARPSQYPLRPSCP